jgi:excinuclease UvrABC nuclease subunit
MLNNKESNMVEQTINSELAHFGITAEIITKQFKLYNVIPSKHNGVYLVSEGDKVVYVGKGQIRARQSKHWQKALAEFKHGTNDTKGWQWLRENYSVYNLTPELWTVQYIILHKQTELTAMEGALIHRLQPLANDETFNDNARTLKG